MSNIKLTNRDNKPRDNGQTMVIDNGYGISFIQDMFETGSEYIDMIKFGFGTALITKNIKSKIKLSKRYNIETYLGGTLFEFFFKKNKLEEFINLASNLKIDIIEISEGTTEIDIEKKLELISLFKKKFKVIIEIGSKVNKSSFGKKEINHSKKCLQAGAWKIIFEGRESGTIGIFNSNKTVRVKSVDNILKSFKGIENKIIL